MSKEYVAFEDGLRRILKISKVELEGRIKAEKTRKAKPKKVSSSRDSGV